MLTVAEIRELGYRQFLRLYDEGRVYTHLDLEADLDVRKDKGSRMRFMSDFKRCVERFGYGLDELIPGFRTRGIVYILPAWLYWQVRDCMVRHRYSERVELVGRPDGTFTKHIVRVARW